MHSNFDCVMRTALRRSSERRKRSRPGTGALVVLGGLVAIIALWLLLRSPSKPSPAGQDAPQLAVGAPGAVVALPHHVHEPVHLPDGRPATLRCEPYIGKAPFARDVEYWGSGPPQDLQGHPKVAEIWKLGPHDKYLLFRTDWGGWNNIRSDYHKLIMCMCGRRAHTCICATAAAVHSCRRCDQ
jgi:hypothetical protein